MAASKMNQFSALIIAIDNNNTSLCRAFLELGWDPNETRIRDGATPLHSAVTNRNFAVIAMLMDYGAIITKRDFCGNLAISRCLKMRMDDVGRNIFRSLAMYMKDEDFRGSDDHGETLLHIAAKNTTIPEKFFQFLIEKNVGIAERDEYTGRNFLMDLIMFCGDEDKIIEVWKMAMAKGLPIGQSDNFGTTLLHRLASEQRAEVLNWAVEEEKVHIRTKNQNGQSAMWLACKRGNIDVVRLVYKFGESFSGSAYESPGASGQSAYDIASTSNHVDVLKLVQMHTGEGKTIRNAHSLKFLSKETIRNALAHGKTNIWPKIKDLELPRTLKAYLGEVEEVEGEKIVQSSGGRET